MSLYIGNRKLSTVDYRLWTKRGFTLLEILVVLMIMGFLVAMVAAHLGGIRRDAAITTALNEMKDIKEAIRDRFYLDLGLIPEDLGPDGISDSLGPDGIPYNGDEAFDGKPEYAVRYLCLKDDGAGPPMGRHRQEMYDFIEDISGTAQANRLIEWDRYSRKGWRGPYMEQEVSRDYDGLVGSGTVYWPIILNPWADYWEAKAKREEELGNDAQADIYRINKCYHIFGGQDKNLARIISFGADGGENVSVTGTDGKVYVCIKTHTADAGNRPVSGGDYKEFWVLDYADAYHPVTWVSGAKYRLGDDLVMFIFGTQPTRSP